MATSSIIVTISLLLLLPACTQARFFPSACNGFISMVTDLGNKTPKSPPSLNPAPPKHQRTNDEPENQASASDSHLQSMVFNSGKIPKSPPSPSPATPRHHATNGLPAAQQIFESMAPPRSPPTKRQGTIEQPTQESWWTPDFRFNSMAVGLGKTGGSPPSPNPAPRKGQEIIEQLVQQRSSQDFQVASS
ncbi:hypothetical protein HRI_001532200 [Hibiscus trionum]|uniref:Uncharacterized protein n=1 Tax=Hibiscus trionum TaxID=183268 RepID=A0A9W7HJ72_HIBTR|nr:hypothetical protein HRI_001532200 [Hibiscus trionum]